MGQESFLLRMLEPAVRPDARAGSLSQLQRRAGGDEAVAPLEQRSFESLLAEAQAVDPADDAATGDAPASAPSPLAPLAQFDCIENDSLRRVIAQARNSTQQ